LNAIRERTKIDEIVAISLDGNHPQALGAWVIEFDWRSRNRANSQMTNRLFNTIQKSKRRVEMVASDIIYGAVDVIVELRK
jgi:hypothetical protein